MKSNIRIRALFFITAFLLIFSVPGVSIAARSTVVDVKVTGVALILGDPETLRLDFSLADLDGATMEAVYNFLVLQKATLSSEIRDYILTVQYIEESGIQHLAFVPTEVYLSLWRLPLPEEHIIRLTLTTEDARQVIRFLQPVGVVQSIQALDYRFPWTNGVAWAKTQGYHYHNMGYSIDFAPGAANANVLAIESGILRSVCLDPYQAMVKVEHSGGAQSGYLHLTSSTVPTGKFNTTVPRGEILGAAYAGSAKVNPHPACVPTDPYKFATACGCGTGTHLHFETNQKITIQGHSLDSISNAAYGTLYTSTNGASNTTERTVNPTLSPVYNGSTCGSGWYKIADNFYLTLNTNNPAESTNSATWRPDLPKSGRWKVEAYIANHSVITWPCAPIAGRTISWDTSDARYTVHHRNGATSVAGNQRPLTNQWLNLGEFYFNTGTNGYVALTDLNGESNLTYSISFNVIRFTLISEDVPPAAPVLAAIANSDGDGNYTVSWNAVSGATSYKLQEDDSSSFSSPTVVYNNSGTSWNASGRPAGAYYYRVQACNASGCGGWSNVQSVIVCAVAGVPTLLSPTDGATLTNPRPLFDWSDASNGVSYQWQLASAASFLAPTQDVTNLTISAYTPGSNVPDGLWYWRVRARNSCGIDGNWTSPHSFTSLTTSLAAPTNLSAAAVSATQINLTWSDNSSNETGFKIERSADGTSGWSEIAAVAVNVTGYANTGLTSGAPYYYRVRAYNTDGNSSYSNTAHATTLTGDTALVYFSSTPATVAPNTLFTITCEIANTSNLGAYEQTFTFDPAVFTVTHVLQGDFLGSTGRAVTFLPPAIDNSDGTVSLGAFSQSSATPPQAGPTGGGILAYIVGRTRVNGTTPLHFTQNQVADIAGVPLPVTAQDGSLTIAACLGDFNGNGEVDISDIQTIANLWKVRQADPRYEARFDLDGNGEIDISDIQTVASRWKMACAPVALQISTSAASPVTATLWLDPPLTTVPVAQTFTVRLSISDATNLAAFETTLNYDAAALEFVSVVPGEFLGSTGRAVNFLPPLVDAAAGQVDLGAYTLAPPETGVDGNGVLVNVTFRARTPGASGLNLTAPQITTPAGAAQVPTSRAGVVEIRATYQVYLPLVVRHMGQ